MQLIKIATGAVVEAVQLLPGKPLPKYVRPNETNLGHYQFQSTAGQWNHVRAYDWVLTPRKGEGDRYTMDQRGIVKLYELPEVAEEKQKDPEAAKLREAKQGGGQGRAGVSRL